MKTDLKKRLKAITKRLAVGIPATGNRQPATVLRLLASALALLATGYWQPATAQDLHFSQFFEAPLLRNPSLAGIFAGDVRVQAVYRDQWNTVTTAYKTVSLNGEYKMPVGKANDFVTIGMQLLQDRAGTISWVSTHVLPAINYHKSLSSERTSYLSLGFMGGWVQKRFDRTKMTTNSMFDGLGDGEINLQPQYSYWDASVGMSYNGQLNENKENNFYLGAAYHHFNKPKNSFFRDPRVELTPKTDISAGVRFAVTEGSYFTLHGNHSLQGEFTETMVGGMYGIKIGDWAKPTYVLHGGLFTRLNDALIPVVKVDYAPFTFSFSYDVNISKLATSSYGRGGFELGISYVGERSGESSSLKAVVCPRF